MKKYLYAFLLLFLSACTAPQPLPTTLPAPTTILNPSTATPSAIPVIETDTPTPLLPSEIPPTETPDPSDTLTICSGDQPEGLYIYGGQMLAQSNVLEAVYDGPIDSNGYGYQPVILEKLPSLADGDAVIQPVTVHDGDFVIDSLGNLIVLSKGDVIRPAGCRLSDCAIPFAGGEGQMDQMSSTFTLLENLKWSDGEPLTAQDSVYSFHLADDPNTPSSKFLVDRTAAYEALDDRTTRWTALPGFLDQTYFLNFWTPLPEHIWKGYTAKELLVAEISAEKPMGWGPYIIDEWDYDTEFFFRLHRNPYYFRADEGLPKFEYLFIRAVYGGMDLILTGECDIVTQHYFGQQSDTEQADYLKLDQAGEVQLITSPGTTWEHADFGIVPYAYDDGYQSGVDRPDFFGDVRTRQAIAMCINREAIADAVYLGLSEIVHSYVPTSHPLFNADAPQYAFDPQAGMTLLDEVGWRDDDGASSTPRVAQGVPRVPDGTPLSFNFWTTESSIRQQSTSMLVASLAQCGIEAKSAYWKAEEFFADGPQGPVFGRNFEMAEFAWLTEGTPPCDHYLISQIPAPNDSFGGGWGGANATGYNNSAFDEACLRALSLLPGEPGYEDAHREAQAIWMADLPSIPLYLRIKMGAARADFCGYQLDPTAASDTWNIEEFGYGEDC